MTGRWSPAVLVLACLCCILSAEANWELEPRVIGGTVVSPPGKYPFLTFLLVFFENANGGQTTARCTATLVSSRWVMTAAHCVAMSNTAGTKNWMIDRAQVWVGAHDLTDGSTGEQADVDVFVPHPLYDPVVMANDVALLHLVKDIDAKYVPAVLPAPGEYSNYYSTGTLMKIAGWGITDTGSVSSVPMEAAVPLVNTTTCQKQLATSELFATLCAGFTQGGVDTCEGDSGGPMFLPINSKNVVFGITSYGDGCALAGKPGVYTGTQAYYAWITETMSMDIDTLCQGTCLTCSGNCGNCQWAIYNCDLSACAHECNVVQDLGDGTCDAHCDSASCKFDAGDCASEQPSDWNIAMRPSLAVVLVALAGVLLNW
eukprot:TRINITY_DN16951_c0_g1_i1.p1 TRINITY_DN16951_c0_g1~~TRINITY_DN16951_c0_g1_i1.p1  ORF type:complete len:372 (-),score=84.33 TRINITY_DN16951_c0_g1_i1:81-1196(-)